MREDGARVLSNKRAQHASQGGWELHAERATEELAQAGCVG
jgi:hypothetical protein